VGSSKVIILIFKSCPSISTNEYAWNKVMDLKALSSSNSSR